MVAFAELAAAVISEVTGAVPRAVDRTRAQLELAQRLIDSLPCGGHGRAGDGAPTHPVVVEARSEVDPTPHEPRQEDPLAPPDTLVPREPSVQVPDADSLAIPDYDSLAASQVVPRLAALDAPELADIGDYERAHRSRQTILNRVRQLQAQAGAG